MAIKPVSGEIKSQDINDNLSYLDSTNSKISERVEKIITTNANGVNKEEIVDARDGESSLGANIRRIENESIDNNNKNKSEITEARLNEPHLRTTNKNFSTTLESLFDPSKMYKLTNEVSNGDFYTTDRWVRQQGALTEIKTINGLRFLEVGSDGSNQNVLIKQDLINVSKGKIFVDFILRTSSNKINEISLYVGDKIITLKQRGNHGNAIPYDLNTNNRIQLLTDETDFNSVRFVFRYSSDSVAKTEKVYIRNMMCINTYKSFDSNANLEQIKEELKKHNIDYFGDYVYFYKKSNDGIKTNALTIDDFGAKADGVTDNYDAFMRAISEVDEIIIPKVDVANGKKYILSKTVVVPSGKTIKGYGSESLVQVGNMRTLTATKWREGMEDFYPVFITESGSSHVKFYNFRLQGASAIEEERIEVGIAYYETTFGEMKGVEVDRINYFPKKAPPRPSGQWRRGWNVLTMRAENIEISYCDIQHGAYECLRVGDYSKRINIHHNVLKYGWRTVLQPLRGSEDIDINDNEITQDDLGYCDTHAALTFHSSEGNTMKNIRIRRNKIRANLFLDQPNGGSAISLVDIHHQDYMFEDNDIESNGYGISYNGYGKVSYVRNKIRSVLTCIPMNSKGIQAIDLIDNDIKSENQSCVSLNNSSDIPLKKLKYRGNTFESSDTARNLVFGGTTEISGGLITDNHFVNSKSPMVLTPNTKKMLVSMNDLTGANESVQDLGEDNMIVNNIE